MAIPDYQSIMLPLLKFLADGKEHNLSEAVEMLSDQFKLTPNERQQLLPSGQQTIIKNRIGWARTYMVKAGLIDSVRRGYWQISSRGKEVLAVNPEKIDRHYLQQFPEFMAFRDLHHEKDEEQTEKFSSTDTPEEALGHAYQRLRSDLESDLLQQVKTASASFFENFGRTASCTNGIWR